VEKLVMTLRHSVKAFLQVKAVLWTVEQELQQEVPPAEGSPE